MTREQTTHVMDEHEQKLWGEVCAARAAELLSQLSRQKMTRDQMIDEAVRKRRLGGEDINYPVWFGRRLPGGYYYIRVDPNFVAVISSEFRRIAEREGYRIAA